MQKNKLRMFQVSDKRLGNYVAFAEFMDAKLWSEENGGEVSEIMADLNKYIYLTGHKATKAEFLELIEGSKEHS